MVDTVDTASVPATERFAYWADEVSRRFQPVASRPLTGAPFRARMTALDFGLFQAHRVTGEAWSLRRTPRSIQDSDPALVQVALQLRGRSRIAQAGREALLRPGDLTAFDTSRPYAVTHDVPFELLLFCVPRHLLGAHGDRMTARAAVAIPGAEGAGRTVGACLRTVALAQQDGALPGSGFEVGEGAIDLLRALYPSPVAGGGADAVPAAALLAEVKAGIERDLGDPRLDPAAIAAGHAISVRRLHRLFEAEEHSVSQWIKARRLERARRDLREGAASGEPIAGVAERWGFGDAASFSRAFREAYGRSPREDRRAATAG